MPSEKEKAGYQAAAGVVLAGLGVWLGDQNLAVTGVGVAATGFAGSKGGTTQAPPTQGAPPPAAKAQPAAAPGEDDGSGLLLIGAAALVMGG